MLFCRAQPLPPPPTASAQPSLVSNPPEFPCPIQHRQPPLKPSRAATECEALQFEAAPPNATFNRVCEAIINCTAAQFEVSSPTRTSDRVCQTARDPCVPGLEYLIQEPTLTSDRVCNALINCTSSEYEIVAPSPTSQRLVIASLSLLSFQSQLSLSVTRGAVGMV